MAGIAYRYVGEVRYFTGEAYTAPPASALYRLKVKTGPGENDIVNYGLTSNVSASLYSPKFLVNGSVMYIGRTEYVTESKQMTTATEYLTSSRASTSDNATFLARQVFTLQAEPTEVKTINAFASACSYSDKLYTKRTGHNETRAWQLNWNTAYRGGMSYSTVSFETEPEMSQGSLTSSLGVSCSWTASGTRFNSNYVTSKASTIKSKGKVANIGSTYASKITNDTSNLVIVEGYDENNVFWLAKQCNTSTIKSNGVTYIDFITRIEATYMHTSLPRITSYYTRTSQYTYDTVYRTASESYTVATTQNYIT